MNLKLTLGTMFVGLTLLMAANGVYAQGNNDTKDKDINTVNMDYKTEDGDVGKKQQASNEDNQKGIKDLQKISSRLMKLAMSNEKELLVQTVILSQEIGNEGDEIEDKPILDSSLIKKPENALPAEQEMKTEKGKDALEELQNSESAINLTDELKLMAATVYGEAASLSETSWEAVANVIMNRLGYREWARYSNVTGIIQYTRFDAATYQNKPFKEAMSYLNSRSSADIQKNETIEKLLKIVSNVYNKKTQDITDGAVLYYSPKAQAALSQRYPGRYKVRPKWNFRLLEEIAVPGTEKDDIKFFRYKVKK